MKSECEIGFQGFQGFQDFQGFRNNLKGIRTTSVEINLIPGNMVVQHLEQIMNDTETSNIERHIHIHTNQSEKSYKYSYSTFNQKSKRYLCRKIEFPGKVYVFFQFLRLPASYGELICKSYSLVKRPNKFHVGATSFGYLESQ